MFYPSESQVKTELPDITASILLEHSSVPNGKKHIRDMKKQDKMYPLKFNHSKAMAPNKSELEKKAKEKKSELDEI